jgi:hypothetical protein
MELVAIAEGAAQPLGNHAAHRRLAAPRHTHHHHDHRESRMQKRQAGMLARL